MLIDIFKINFIEKWLCLNIQKCPKKTFKDPLSDAFPMLLLYLRCLREPWIHLYIFQNYF